MDNEQRDRIYLACGCGFQTCLSFAILIGLGMTGSEDPFVLLCIVGSFLAAMVGALLVFSAGNRVILAVGRGLFWVSGLLVVATCVKAVLSIL